MTRTVWIFLLYECKITNRRHHASDNYSSRAASAVLNLVAGVNRLAGRALHTTTPALVGPLHQKGVGS